MKDRVVEFPNRYKLVPVAGQSDVVDLVPMPGIITEAGTALNKAGLLSDETALALGMPQENPTINDALNMIIPKGVILLWKGSVSGIPVGWRLCDGANGTPDLRNRFVVGAGGKYAVEVNGGAEKITMSAHSHTIGGSTQVAVNPSYTPQYSVGSGSSTVQPKHYHNFSATSSGAGSGEYNTLPPYYALCYIMKI